jgi:signal transduction histidine kinase
MMRPALITILPMLAAAILVMVGGERMARRDVETRSPADRERLLDFDEAFRAELARLDDLYLGHLDKLTEAAHSRKPDELSALAAEITGVRLIRIFRDKGKNKDDTIRPGLDTRRLPEIVLTNGKRPFDPNRASVLDVAMLDEALPATSKWLATSDPGLRLHCRTPEKGVLVVILIDVPAVHKATSSHLTRWIETPLTPLREAGERVLIESLAAGPLATIGPTQHGPAASIIPIRTLFGEWQIRSWDGLFVTRSHDPAVITVAATLFILLFASGVMLFIQQKRALKLAAERVSFVNRVSHELGTPLTNLSLNLDLATESLSARPAEARRRLGLVAEEIERLSRLVANVLTFSRRERDSLVLKPVRCLPAEVIWSVIESFRPALERRGIVIETDISAANPILLDPDALSQIAGNLVSNVEKYAADGHWLGLTCFVEADFLVLEVRDRGKGIPANARQRIFVPFERVLDATNEGASGTGLGLSIGRDLARRMGGDLELLESTEGAAFRLRTPAPPSLALVSSTDAA